jgi:ribonuclease D
MKVRSISALQISKLPLLEWTGDVKVLVTMNQMEGVTALLMKKETVLGFDVEYLSGGRLPALVQLATATCVYLFRILGSALLLATLIPLFKSEAVVKAGVGVYNDCLGLSRLEYFHPRGFHEIADMTSHLGFQHRGLRALAAMILGKRVSKAKPTAKGWAQTKLNTEQITYAATDAWVGLRLFLVVKEKSHTL